ncbi:MAG: carboxypeptidase-like regulatory domain-containing protein [Acidobacteriia bacterium]|nr:carboxypeptidase-like regulatory domain-containing protein [Terriglobia bacterium]
MADKPSKFKLEVPLDASGIKGFQPTQPVKVIVVDQSGKASEAQVVQLDAKGQGVAAVSFDSHPGSARVIVGPQSASADDLRKLQTLNVNVSSSQWQEDKTLRLSPVAISSYHWWWWLRWCRDYVIRGRLVCANGSPVPGATVCAYDVDRWWWWVSEEQVGCAVTDANGAFEIDFRRCCGWLWWWWWELREWRLEPLLADRIMPILQKIPGIRRIPTPDPTPDLSLFHSLLAKEGTPHFNAPSAAVARLASSRAKLESPVESSSLTKTRRPAARSSAINPGALESLRGQLLEKLSLSPELERLRLWPWWPWWPWWDCDADIVFRATQNCNGQTKVILDESILQVRFDIPAELNVNLVANDQACCIVQPCQDGEDCPQGSCLVPFDICSATSASVGGNEGASMAAATIGYALPGDHPFADNVTLSSIFGSSAAVDYYEFEYATSVAGPWSAMPPAASGGFGRYYWVVNPVPTPTLVQVPVPFSAVSINSPDGLRNVFESRQHYEANNSVGVGWDALNYNLMMVWQTLNHFSDGTYYLRLKAWTRAGYAGDLSNKRILPFCGTTQDNYVVITIDNRAEGASSGHPTDHPCGMGTVHICTTEPDCNITDVRIDGVSVGPCGSQQASAEQTVEIDLMVHDPDGHLAYYTLASNYKLNLTIPIIYAGGHIGTLVPGPAASFNTSWIGPAAQAGPDYGTALTQGAVAPHWSGGTVTLTAKVKDIFPETCCYQLELWAYKRTIVDCSTVHANRTELSFTIIRV